MPDLLFDPSPKPLMRSIYLLASHNGKVLLALTQDSPCWTVAPQQAVAVGMSWLSLEIAHRQLLLARELLPTFYMHLAQLDMIQERVGKWIPVGLRILG